MYEYTELFIIEKIKFVCVIAVFCVGILGSVLMIADIYGIGIL